MTTLTIKLLAILFMLIDHIGVIFFPEELLFRIIGRLGFPLFAWLAANGAQHTSDLNRYISRIFLCAILAQIPYVLAVREVYPTFWDLNALFGIVLGLLAVSFIRTTKNNLVHILIALLFAVTAILFHVDYGAVGVLSVILFYLFYGDFKRMFISQSLLFTLPYYLPIIIAAMQQKEFSQNNVNLVEPIALLSLFVIKSYSGHEGRKMRYLFYLFYPVHLLILFLIKRLLTF